jgi:hypothetical protein
MLVTNCSSVDMMGSMLHVQSIATSTNPAICKPSINCMVSAGHWRANISKLNSEQGRQYSEETGIWDQTQSVPNECIPVD